MGRLITFIKNNWIILLLVLASIIMRVSILGLADYPIQARTLDSSYNIAMTQWVAQGNLNNMPAYMAAGYDNVIQYHPPFLYLFPALISKLGIAPWNAAAGLFAVMSGLITLILFLIGKKMGCEEAGLVAATLNVFPFPTIWLFPLYNGMWGLLCGQFFLILEILLLASYYEKRTRKKALVIGLIIATQFLTHYPEAAIILPFLGAIVLHKYFVSKNKQLIKDMIALSIFPLLALIWQAPKLANVWLKQLHTGLHLFPEVTSRLASIISISNNTTLWALTAPVIIFLLIGLFFLYKNRMMYWLAAGIYFITIPLTMPYFVNEAEFFVKLRFFLPLIAYPIAAYGLIKLIERFTQWKKMASLIFIIIIVLIANITFVNFLSQTYTPLTKEKYNFLNWIEQNTEENSTIFYHSGYSGFTSVFGHRTCFEAQSGDQGLWCGFFWSEAYTDNYLLPYEKNFFTYGYYQRPLNTTPDFFDYIVYQGNQTELDDFKTIHNQNDLYIAKNCIKHNCLIS